MYLQGKLIGFIPTLDAAAARAFYEGSLGMRFLQDDGFAIVLEAGGNLLRIARVPSFTPHPFTVLGWEVEEISSAVRTLADAGIAFQAYGLPGQGTDGIWKAPDGARVAWFKDPDGNLLSLSQHA